MEEKLFKEIDDYFESENINIEGRNAEPIVNANFQLISSPENPVSKIYNEEELEIIKKLEKWADKFFKRASSERVNPMKFSTENGKLAIPNGTIAHRTTANLDMLKAISKSGVMATEWFGLNESAQEGRLCSFVTEKQTFERNQDKGPHMRYTQISYKKDDECVLYFDKDNILLQSLMEMDYFEYEYLKKHNPEKIEEIYPKFFIELFDKVIGPKSPGGKDIKKYETYHRAWKAIPGGIPAAFINGICISSEGSLAGSVEELEKIFPRATIFNEKGEILNVKIKEKEDEFCDD